MYHFSHGKGVVTYTAKEHIHVMFDNGERVLTQFAIELLSFTPYEINSDWERPYEPKDGDIVVTDEWVVIFRRLFGSNKLGYYAFLNTECNKITFQLSENHHVGYLDSSVRPATPEEKQTLFDALEKEGRRWNAEKKELENIPEPLKAGDLVIAYNKLVPKEAFIIYYENILFPFDVVVKFKSMEQYEKIRRGEI